MDEYDGLLAPECRMKKSREYAAIVYCFCEGSVLLHLVVAWGLRRRRDFNTYVFINCWFVMNYQPQRARRAQSVVVYLCVPHSVIFSIGAAQSASWNYVRAYLHHCGICVHS
jgi:hypothetical protein